MKKLLSDKYASLDMTYKKEEESDSKNVNGYKMYVENLRKEMKNHGLSKNEMFLLYSDCIMCEKRSLLYNKGVLPSRETLSSTFLSYQLSTLLYKYLLGILP